MHGQEPNRDLLRAVTALRSDVDKRAITNTTELASAMVELAHQLGFLRELQFAALWLADEA